MERIEQILEMRGMSRRSLVDYFLELGGKTINGLHFITCQWEVFVYPEGSCSLGSISVPSTKIIFKMDEEIAEEFLLKFRMNFLCAGG